MFRAAHDTFLSWQKCSLLSSRMGFKLGCDWVLNFGGDFYVAFLRTLGTYEEKTHF